MRKVLCFSHGWLAKGMVETVKMIAGDFANLDYYCAYTKEDEDVEKEIDQIIQANENHELFVVSDIFGGSVNNEWMKRINKDNNIHLISGMNLAFLIDLLVQLSNEEADSQTAIVQAMASANDGFTYCNQLQLNMTEDEF